MARFTERPVASGPAKGRFAGQMAVREASGPAKGRFAGQMAVWEASGPAKGHFAGQIVKVGSRSRRVSLAHVQILLDEVHRELLAA